MLYLARLCLRQHVYVGPGELVPKSVTRSPRAQSRPGPFGTITATRPGSRRWRSRGAGRRRRGDERELARVVAALDRDQPQRTGHIFVNDLEDPLGRFHGSEAHRVGDLCTALRAASTSSYISPPSSCGGRCPSTTFASVTVGSSPPLP